MRRPAPQGPPLVAPRARPPSRAARRAASGAAAACLDGCRAGQGRGTGALTGMREPRTWRSAQPEGLVLHLRLSLVQAEGLAARRVASGVRKAELVPRKQERQRASLRDDGGRRRHPRVADAGRCAGGVESVRERRRARSSALAVSEGGEETRPGEVEGGAGGLRHAARAERPRDRRGRGARRGAQSPRREVGRCSGQAERLSHPQASLVVVDGEARVGVGDRAALGVVAREEPLLLAEAAPHARSTASTLRLREARSDADPRWTAASFHAMLCASCRPVFMPKAPAGGNWCAASPSK